MATANKLTGKIVPRIDQPWQGANASRYLTARKMIAFVCPENLHNGSLPDDRKACIEAGHEPYESTKRIARTREKTEIEVDEKTGEEIEVVTDTETYYVKKKVPNWEQVIVDVAHDSGTTLNRRLNEGWVYPENLGYAPFCDYLNCSAQNPKHRTAVGNYHLRDEAAMMILQKGGKEGSVFGTAIFIDDPTSEDRRRIQLDEVAARFDRG